MNTIRSAATVASVIIATGLAAVALVVGEIHVIEIICRP